METLKNKSARGIAVIAAVVCAVALLTGLYAAFTPKDVSAQDVTYGPKVYHDQGGDRLVIAAGGTLDASAGTLTLAAGQINSAKIASGAIDSTKLAASSVDTSKLITSAADTGKILCGKADKGIGYCTDAPSGAPSICHCQ